MVQYYFLKDLKQIGKREDEQYYLFDEDRGWIADEEKRIIDRLIGFDSTKTRGFRFSYRQSGDYKTD